MVTLKKARELIARVSYHGMIFEIYDGQFMQERFSEVIQLLIRHKVTDAGTLKLTEVTTKCNYRYDMIRDENDFYNWVWRMVKDRMLHEAGEFFLIDGRRVHDPHKNDYMSNRI